VDIRDWDDAKMKAQMTNFVEHCFRYKAMDRGDRLCCEYLTLKLATGQVRILGDSINMNVYLDRIREFLLVCVNLTRS
jgi:hypothetical protein